MKQKTKTTLAITVVVILVGIIAYMISLKPIEKIVQVPVPYPTEVFVQREPEFRKPPIKEYKPGHVQQMGVLLGEDGDTLPPLWERGAWSKGPVSLLYINTWRTNIFSSHHT